MTTHTLVKVVINNFMHFNNVEIDEKSCNLINSAFANSEAIQSYISAFEFIFANKELSIEEIRDGVDQNVDENNMTFVEAVIQLNTGEAQILRKSIVAGSFRYKIDDAEVTSDDFTNTLKNLKLFYNYASFFQPETLGRITQLSDENRGTFLDILSNHDSNRVLYKRLQAQIEDFRMIMKHHNDQIKECTADKKVSKQRIENEPRMREAERKREEKQQQLTLFKLHHNEKAIESVKNETAVTEDKQRQVIAEYEQSLTNFRDQRIEKEDFEDKMRDSYNQQNQLQNKRLKKTKRNLNREWEMNHLSEQKSSIAKFERGQYDKKANAKIKNIENLMERLNAVKQDFNGGFNDFCKTQMNNLSKNPKFVCYLICQQLQDRIDTIKDISVKYQHSLKHLEENANSLDQQLYDTKNKYTSCKLEQTHFKSLIAGQKAEIHKTEIIIEAYERLLVSDRIKFKYGISKIAEELKKQFGDGVIGILSDLFETTDCLPIIRNGIIELLGEKGDSIIVQDKKVLEKCIQYIKSLKDLKINVTLVLINSWTNQSQKPINVPENLPAKGIANFIKTSRVEIKNILLSFLQPMLVCGSEPLDIFRALAKKIAVTNFNESISFMENGLIIVFSKLESLLADGNINGIIENLQDLRITEILLKYGMAENEYKLNAAEERAEYLRVDLSCKKEFYQRIMQKIDDQKKKLAAHDAFLSHDFHEHNAMYETMRNEFQKLIADSFKSMLKKYKLSSYDDFRKAATLNARMDSNLKFIPKIQNTYKELVKLFPDAEFSRELNERIEELQEEIDSTNDEEITVEKIDHAANEMENYEKLGKEIENLISSASGQASKLNSLASESFVLLNHAIMKSLDIANTDGDQMKEIFEIFESDNIDINEDLILDLLSKLNIDTSDLDGELKEEDDIYSKESEMEDELEVLDNALNKFPVLIQSDKEGLKVISKEIKQLETKINKTSKEHEEFADIFKNIRIRRISSFNECLDVVNQEIAKFCRIALNNSGIGELRPVDDVEPYLNKLQYFWRTENGEECLNETKENYMAALALFLGILKYKNQRQINYVDDSNMKEIRNALQKYAENEETDLQCNILSAVKDNNEKCHNTIIPSNINFKIVNH